MITESKMKRCKHGDANAIRFGAHSYLCLDCGARGVRGLGPANDEPTAVQIEIMAAVLVTCGPDLGVGWCAHEHGWPEHQTGSFEDAWWLSRELCTHMDHYQRDATAWSWDISRPIAEQLAETALVDSEADSIVCECTGDQLAGDRCHSGTPVVDGVEMAEVADMHEDPTLVSGPA